MKTVVAKRTFVRVWAFAPLEEALSHAAEPCESQWPAVKSSCFFEVSSPLQSVAPPNATVAAAPTKKTTGGRPVGTARAGSGAGATYGAGALGVGAGAGAGVAGGG